MDSFLALIGLAIIVFASTNIDDIFVLIGFFVDKSFRVPVTSWSVSTWAYARYT
jgi:hypothetical protein